MQIFDLTDEQNRLKAFEVSRIIGRRRICRFIEKLPDVTLLYESQSSGWYLIAPSREETVCRFEMAGVVFEVSEPFGDSSRYWIGPQDCNYHEETQILKEAFQAL